jgi:hyperosmotically inducible protein
MKFESRSFLALTCVASLSLAGCGKPPPLVAVVPPSQAQLTAAVVAKTFEAGDADITARVKAALGADAMVGGLGIGVVTLRGDVKLSGSVDNTAQIGQALKVAHATEGVLSIQDELNVKR